ncbi:MAG: riboflavin synthase [Spirochaetales bacterium]|nr:riboflavin synthase [Spirochaetales bacterium]
MFTGIIEECGTIKEIGGPPGAVGFTVAAVTVLKGTKKGDSIAVNGVCVTVNRLSPDSFSFALTPETMERTVFKQMKKGDRCNLERALRAGDPFGGHFVTGHCDGTAQIAAISARGDSRVFKIKADRRIMKYIASKGSVAVDGISLTPYDCTDTDFTVSVIPLTLEQTTLKDKKQGDMVNIEADILCKYLERLVDCTMLAEEEKKKSTIDKDYLKKTGFLI